MEFSGEYIFDTSREIVWRGLNSPAVLSAAIPGCEKLSDEGDGLFSAHLKLKFGLLSFRTRGVLRLEIIDDARSYRLHGQSGKTIFGTGGGIADVSLSDGQKGGTKLTFHVTAKLEGKLAKIGEAVVAGQMQNLGVVFFERLERAMLEE